MMELQGALLPCRLVYKRYELRTPVVADLQFCYRILVQANQSAAYLPLPHPTFAHCKVDKLNTNN